MYAHMHTYMCTPGMPPPQVLSSQAGTNCMGVNNSFGSPYHIDILVMALRSWKMLVYRTMSENLVPADVDVLRCKCSSRCL